MPGISSSARARIFQRPVLQALFAQAQLPSVADQLFAVCRDKVGEGLALPHMVMQPQAAVHRVDHSLAATLKFPNVELVAEFRHEVPHTRDRVLIGRSAVLRRSPERPQVRYPRTSRT